jgi:hypothetical protein
MRFVVLAIATLGLGGCSKEIGDACIVSTDCSPRGDRMCDTLPKEGYCTIMGCDYNTCPQEAVCVRFFQGQFQNKPCTESTATTDCNLDELCDLQGHCVPRSTEIRYCMRKCDRDKDCRDSYECRTLQRMIDHGGEPVLAPGSPIDDRAPKFCAQAPANP